MLAHHTGIFILRFHSLSLVKRSIRCHILENNPIHGHFCKWASARAISSGQESAQTIKIVTDSSLAGKQENQSAPNGDAPISICLARCLSRARPPAGFRLERSIADCKDSRRNLFGRCAARRARWDREIGRTGAHGARREEEAGRNCTCESPVALFRAPKIRGARLCPLAFHRESSAEPCSDCIRCCPKYNFVRLLSCGLRISWYEGDYPGAHLTFRDWRQVKWILKMKDGVKWILKINGSMIWKEVIKVYDLMLVYI